ncbi:MAG: GNAT family N-acetyltransferase [Saprospiraceae bacterium]|nr:GNAT family N-acetyltransferase [Saprospiraceae bacterium]
MTYRQVDIKDLYDLVEIACTTFIDTFSEQNDPTEFYSYVERAFAPEQILSELNTEGSVFYFAEMDSTPIGYFKINNNKSAADTDRPRFYADFSPFQSEKMTELERIYVKKAFQGKGAAQNMMSFIEKCARQSGSRYLWLGVWSENKKAIRFYEKCGFSIFGEHIFQIGDDAQLDYLMWKKL